MKSRRHKWASPLFIVSLAVAGLFGVTAVALDKKVEETPILEKAEAGNSGKANDVIYFRPSGKWAQANAKFKIIFSYATAEKDRVLMTKATFSKGQYSEHDLWYAKATQDFTHIQFFRYSDDGGTYWGWASNYFSLSDSGYGGASGAKVVNMDWNSNWETTWYPGDSGSGTTWKNLDIKYKSAEQTPSSQTSSSTVRIFMYNSGTHWETNNYGSPCALRAWGGRASPSVGSANATASIYYLSWITDNSSVWYGYADIPSDITGFQFVKSVTGTNLDYYEFDISYNSQDFDLTTSKPARVFYAPSGGNDFTVGGAKDNKAYVELLSAVYQAYDTCKDSDLFGYGAATDLNTYFYSHAQGDAASNSVQSLNGETRTITVHQEAMVARKDGNKYNGAIRSFSPFNMMNGEDDSLPVVIIIVASSVALLSITALSVLVVKKRKVKEE